MQIKDTFTLLVTFAILYISHSTAKELFSPEDNELTDEVNDLDLIADGRSKRTLNDLQYQNSFIPSLSYQSRLSMFPRQVRQSPYFALRGKRFPDEYISPDDNNLFNEEHNRDTSSDSENSRDKRMISLLPLPSPRYETLIRRIIGQSMKMSDDKAKDLAMDKRQHYRFHALRG